MSNVTKLIEVQRKEILKRRKSILDSNGDASGAAALTMPHSMDTARWFACWLIGASRST